MSGTEDKREQIEQKKQLYLQRVEQLYANIKDWLKDEQLVLVPTDLEIIDTLGSYKSTLLTIKTPTGKTLAEFNPRGASINLAEGLINIEGWLGSEYLAYMVDGGPCLVKLNTDEKNKWTKEPYYSSMSVDGWYWMDGTQKDSAHIVDKALLLMLIFHVSD
jgi:hypothetical protein